MYQNSPQYEQDYIEHIMRRAGAHRELHEYVPRFKELYQSIAQNGFDHDRPIAVNKNMMILEGAHRTVCCEFVGDRIPIAVMDTEKHWPLWGAEWFNENGMGHLTQDLHYEMHMLKHGERTEWQSMKKS